jgi:hypothetical protein
MMYYMRRGCQPFLAEKGPPPDGECPRLSRTVRAVPEGFWPAAHGRERAADGVILSLPATLASIVPIRMLGGARTGVRGRPGPDQHGDECLKELWVRDHQQRIREDEGMELDHGGSCSLGDCRTSRDVPATEPRLIEPVQRA